MARTAEAPHQEKLLNVKQTEAGREAERYSELKDDIENRKHLLLAQGEKVTKAMEKAGQKTLTYQDEHGYKRTFTIVEGVTKLRYSKREEA